MTQFVCLPGDVLELIADFMATSTLSHVNRAAWYAAHGRYLHVRHVRPSEVPKVVCAAPALRILRLDLRHRDVSALVAHRLVQGLQGATQLHNLVLWLQWSTLGTAGVAALGQLRSVPCLQSLTMHLGNNNLTAADMPSLALLCGAPRLQELTVDLRENCIEAEGAESLAGLWSTPVLKSLTLDVRHNHLGPLGAKALMGLRRSPTLSRLCLHLEGNNLGREGAQCLGMLGGASCLRDLQLWLGRNNMDAGSAAGLVGLCECPLQQLLLDVRDNPLGPQDSAVLATIKGQMEGTCKVTYVG